MVRPVEISGLLSNAQENVRMQQSAEMRPEAALEFSKALSEKLKLQQTHAPTPTPETDQVVIHVDEQEREKRKTAEDHMDEHEPGHEDEHESEDISSTEQPVPEKRKPGEDDSTLSGHIDIKV